MKLKQKTCCSPAKLVCQVSCISLTLLCHHWCRIGNLLVPNDNYCKFEDWLMPILNQMLLEQNTEVSLFVWFYLFIPQILSTICALHVIIFTSCDYFRACVGLPPR